MATNRSVLDFQDPGVLSEELLDMPGFVNKLTDYTLTQAHSPNRTLAFVGAVAMLAHLTGRSYVDRHGTRTNIYLIALGETGIGKDAPRRTNVRLADTLGQTPTLCDAIASGEALEELMARHPTVLFQPDEVESFLGSLGGPGKTANSLSERIRRLYSSSANLYSVRSTAKYPEGTVIPFPHLTMYGTGTPQAFHDTLDPHSIVNGLFGRCLVIEVTDEFRTNYPIDCPPPDDILDIARWHTARERNTEETNELIRMTVDETPEASAAFASSDEFVLKIRKELQGDNLQSARALIVRMNDKIAKLAMIRAISADPEHPLITGDDVRWAAKFVIHVTKAMLYEAQFHVAEGKFDKLVKRFITLLKTNDGSLDRRSIIRSLHVDHQTFKRIVMTLHMCDEIIEESESGRNVIYTLKTSD